MSALKLLHRACKAWLGREKRHGEGTCGTTRAIRLIPTCTTITTTAPRVIYTSGVPARVRDFLYLDPALVAQTLSQLDFGVFKEWEETLERAGGKEGGGELSLWGAASIRLGGQHSEAKASSVVLEQTAESYASRLLLRLEEEQQIARLESDASAELRRGVVVVAEGQIERFDIESIERQGWSSDVMLKLHDVQEQASDLDMPGEFGFGTEKVKAVGVIRAGSITVVAPWLPESLRVPIEELNGEQAEVLGIVRRAYSSPPNTLQTLAIVRPIAAF